MNGKRHRRGRVEDIRQRLRRRQPKRRQHGPQRQHHHDDHQQQQQQQQQQRAQSGRGGVFKVHYEPESPHEEHVQDYDELEA